MRPLSLYVSDGELDLGSAIVAAQVLGSGVRGVMNGRILPAKTLNKNVEQGRFDASSGAGSSTMSRLEIAARFGDGMAHDVSKRCDSP